LTFIHRNREEFFVAPLFAGLPVVGGEQFDCVK